MFSGILLLHTAHMLRKQKLHLQQLNQPHLFQRLPVPVPVSLLGPICQSQGRSHHARARICSAKSITCLFPTRSSHSSRLQQRCCVSRLIPALGRQCSVPKALGCLTPAPKTKQHHLKNAASSCQPWQVVLCSQGCTGGGRRWPHCTGLKLQQSFCVGRRFDFPKAPAFQPFCSLQGAQHVSNSGKT